MRHDTLASCLDRIDRLNGRIGAMVHVDRARAVADAAASAARWSRGAPLSAIDGMPVAIKGNIAVAGLPWTGGIEAYRDRSAETDAPCVARLRAAGAVIVGLTNMDEGALGALTDNPWFGRTHNPHAYGFTAGGSSGGSAAAVAAGFCTAALGTDTIGSIRIPASYCGVVGHKPGHGTIPTEGVLALSPTLDHAGVIAASTTVCSAMIEVTGDTILARASGLEGRTLAILAPEEVKTQPIVAEAVARAARRAQTAGARIVETTLAPYPFTRMQRLLLLIAEVEGARVHRAAMEARPAGFSPQLTTLLRWGAAEGEARYEAAIAEVGEVAAAARQALAHFDALLLPATPHVAFAFDGPVPADQSIFTALGSCLGMPATAFPMGVDPVGLPLSVQVVAADDALCLSIAAALSASANLPGHRDAAAWSPDP